MEYVKIVFEIPERNEQGFIIKTLNAVTIQEHIRYMCKDLSYLIYLLSSNGVSSQTLYSSVVNLRCDIMALVKYFNVLEKIQERIDYKIERLKVKL